MNDFRRMAGYHGDNSTGEGMDVSPFKGQLDSSQQPGRYHNAPSPV